MQHLIVTYGPAAIFLLMVAESACIPIPSEVTMLLGGALAAGAVGGSHPDLATVIAAGTLGNVAGSYLAWLAGRFGGRPALYTLAGCLPWTAALAFAGYGVGANWHHLEQTLRGPSYLVAAVAALAIAVVVHRRRRAERAIDRA